MASRNTWAAQNTHYVTFQEYANQCYKSKGRGKTTFPKYFWEGTKSSLSGSEIYLLKIRIQPGLCPIPVGGAYSAPITSSWINGAYFHNEKKGEGMCLSFETKIYHYSTVWNPRFKTVPAIRSFCIDDIDRTNDRLGPNVSKSMASRSLVFTRYGHSKHGRSSTNSDNNDERIFTRG